MSITADPPLAPAAEPPRPAPRARPGPLMRVLQVAASLRLTVILFVLSFFLVFLGTLAQIDYGIGTVTQGYFRSWLVFIPFQVFVQFGQTFFGVPRWFHLGGSFPYPAGLTLGLLLTINLLSAHATRFKLSWRRSGVIILHAGLILLLLAEFITHAFAVEGRMNIAEGQTVSSVLNLHASEFAVIDTSDKKTDTITAVPSSLLRRKGDTVSDARLPFDMECVAFYPNSATRAPEPGEENLADQGLGKERQAVSVAEVSGVAADQRVDIPSAYVTLKDKTTGKAMGTWLFSAYYEKPQKVQVGGKTYEVALRFKERPRPFSLTLIKFSFDRYPHTDKPHNYSSLVRLVDPEYGIDEEILIRMNEPLRHRGEAFYQSSFDEDEHGTKLQVVRNPGWLLPYASCVIVSVGLIVHFSIVLASFLQKRGA